MNHFDIKSGEKIEFTDKFETHNNDIKSSERIMVEPDGIDPEKAIEIYKKLFEEENDSFTGSVIDTVTDYSINEADDTFDKMIDDDVYDMDEDENYFDDEALETKGGSYKDVKRFSFGDTHEVHHVPSDSSYDILNRNDGPAIRMEKEDHKKTASYGNSKEAIEYRAKQKELINQGKFMEALKMDIEDIKAKFGDKYDEEIQEALDYVKELIDEGKISDDDGVLDELYEMIKTEEE